MSDPAAKEAPILTVVGKVLVVVAILLLGGGIAASLVKFGKKAQEAAIPQAIPDVEYRMMTLEDVPLVFSAQGVLEAATETRLGVEVSGRIATVSPAWEDGATVAAGEMLLQIDAADYEAAAAQATSAVAEAIVSERMEAAKAEQALRDWKKLGSGDKPSDLVTREPQLRAAQAKLAAVRAAEAKAKRDVDRTTLRAPFAGRLRRTMTDLGATVSAGTIVAELFAATPLRVKLPLSIDEFALLDSELQKRPVELSVEVGGHKHKVSGAVVGNMGEIERTSRSKSLVVEVKPEAENTAWLVPGLFVHAQIPGVTLSKVARVPRTALLAPGNRIALVDAAQKLHLREVEVARGGKDDAYVSKGLVAGDRVVTTTLAIATEGMIVRAVALP
jgi:RND family efflux transporter MFP subunit